MATIKYKDENGQWQEIVIGTGGGGSITLDTEMSDTSTNAVSNKTIKKYVDDKVASGGITIVDNLNSSDSTAALSANQGKALKEMIWDCPTSEEVIAALREATGALLIYDEASFLRWWEAFCNLPTVTANTSLAYIFDVVGFYLIDYVQGLTDAGEIEIQYNKDDKRYSRIYNTNTGVVISTSEITTGGSGDITVDAQMSDTSENAVSNKVIKEYVDNAAPHQFGEDFSEDFN